MSIPTGHVSSTPDAVMRAITTQMLDTIPNIDDESIIVTLEENQSADEPPSPAPGQVIYTVKLGPGRFDESLLDGGGYLQSTIEHDIIIGIWTIIRLDEIGRDKVVLTDSSVGLMPYVTQVLLSLNQFYPADDSGAAIFREPMVPGGISWRKASEDLRGAILTFHCTFDWNMIAASIPGPSIG